MEEHDAAGLPPPTDAPPVTDDEGPVASPTPPPLDGAPPSPPPVDGEASVGSASVGTADDAAAGPAAEVLPVEAEEPPLPEKFLALVAQLEASYNGQILSLKQQLDVSERKARNAK